jgi:hypothetical protein
MSAEPRPVKGATAARIAAYDDGLLAALAAHAGLELSTADVAAAAGPAYHPPDGLTGRRLRDLYRRGLVTRSARPGWRAAFWTLAHDAPPWPAELHRLDAEAWPGRAP